MGEYSFSRTQLLVGEEALERLKGSKVVVFGIGGVGSFVSEALARSFIGELILIDSDVVSISNINRQIHATTKTVGRSKVELMKERILDINPQCKVTTYETFVTKDNMGDIIPNDADYVVDAIDTVTSKLDLIQYCTEKGIKIISSMGTGNKLDPTRFKVTDVFKTDVCPLAKVMRHELKKRGIKKCKVLYSDELPRKPITSDEPKPCGKLSDSENKDRVTIRKRQTPASISFVPPVAGMIIGGEVIKDIIKEYI